jgi:hypothetical protein
MLMPRIAVGSTISPENTLRPSQLAAACDSGSFAAGVKQMA